MCNVLFISFIPRTVIMRRGGVIILVVKMSFPACNVHSPYYAVICGLSVLSNYSTLCHKRHEFRRNLVYRKRCALIFVQYFSI
jgi:hypothetical protein